jgi:hypothetical protein
MEHELPIRARELPAITIPASDFDRLADLVESAPPVVAPYLRRELARARIAADFACEADVARASPTARNPRSACARCSWSGRTRPTSARAASPCSPRSVRR